MSSMKGAFKRLSRKLLEANEVACVQAKKDWLGLSRGRFSTFTQKPECPFCEMSNGYIECVVECALGLLNEVGDCGEEFWDWEKIALGGRNSGIYKHPLKTKACREAARKMYKFLCRVLIELRAEKKRRK